MKKKTAVILASVVFSAILFAGCGNKEATEAASQGEKTVIEEDGEEEQQDEKEATEESKKKEEEKVSESSESEEKTTEENEETTETEEAKVVAVLLPDEDQASDGEMLRTELEAAGYEAKVLYADNNGATQAEQISEMAEEEVSAFVIDPADAYALTDALAAAKEKSIPVFSYDDLIMDSDAVSYYVTFNTREIGQALGNAIIENKGLEKAKEENKSYNIEFLMGSTDDIKSLYLYNGVMEVLQPYLDDGTLVCQSGLLEFNDTGILRFSEQEAERRIKNLLAEYYQGKTLDIICTSFDQAAYGAASALENVGIQVESEQWPLITGVGCDLDAVKGIAQGSQYCSVFMDREILAKKCTEMVDAYLTGEDPEVTDYEQYDNGKKIIGTYTCEIQLIDKDNYELLIDKGYYEEEEIQPQPSVQATPSPTQKAEQEKETEREDKVTPTPKEEEKQA